MTPLLDSAMNEEGIFLSINLKTNERHHRVIEQNSVRYAYTFSLEGKDYAISI